MGLAFSPVRPRVCSAKRTRLFSLWLTARTTNCSSTLKKGDSQSKSLLNDRVRSLFGRSLESLLSFEQQHSPFLLCPVSRRFTTLSRQPFSPLALPCFSTARFRRVFSGFLYAGVIGGLCRRAALPVLRAPSVCPVALSPLCPDAYTPNGFVFRTTTPCDPFRPRAGFHVKQTRTSRCSISSTATRVNSRPLSLPGCLFHLSVLNDYLARTFPPARRYPCQTNKSFSSPYVFNRATSIFSHSVRPAYRQGTAAHKNHLSSSS